MVPFKFLYICKKTKPECLSKITKIYSFFEIVGSVLQKLRLIFLDDLAALIKLKLSFGFKNLVLTSLQSADSFLAFFRTSKVKEKILILTKWSNQLILG